MNGATANATKRNTALIGAGQLGSNLANDLLGNPKAKFNPCFFVDADKLKIGRKVAGLEVYSPEDAPGYIDKHMVTDVIISITNLSNERALKVAAYFRRYPNYFSSYRCNNRAICISYNPKKAQTS